MDMASHPCLSQPARPTLDNKCKSQRCWQMIVTAKVLEGAGTWGGVVGPQPALLPVWLVFRPSVARSSDRVKRHRKPTHSCECSRFQKLRPNLKNGKTRCRAPLFEQNKHVCYQTSLAGHDDRGECPGGFEVTRSQARGDWRSGEWPHTLGETQGGPVQPLDCPHRCTLIRGAPTPLGSPAPKEGGQRGVPTVCFTSCAGCLCGTWGDSMVKRLLLWGKCSSELLGVLEASLGGEGNSSSFRPFRLSRAGLMRGLRWCREPELEATEPATEGAGEGSGEGQLLDSREK